MDIKENNNSNNCLWLINAMKQYNSESDISLYNWKRYNSKKEKIILYDNHTYNKEIILQKEEVKDNITYLDILYKNENVLIKYAVYPDNKIRA